MILPYGREYISRLQLIEIYSKIDIRRKFEQAHSASNL